jgi:phage gpG-like protein
MAFIQMQDAGFPGLQETLARMEARAKDFRPAMKNAAKTVREAEKRVFASRGPGWAPLSPAYAIRKSKLYPGKPIMEAAGTLKQAFTVAGAANSVEIIARFGAEIGAAKTDAMPYTLAQHYGIPKRNLPARPLLPPLGDIEQPIIDSVAKHLLAGE